MDRQDDGRADQIVAKALRYYGNGSFEFTVGLTSVAAVVRAFERRGFHAEPAEAPGRLRVKAPPSPADIAAREARATTIGKALRAEIRRRHLAKPEAMRLTGASEEEFSLLLQGSYAEIGLESLIRMIQGLGPERKAP